MKRLGRLCAAVCAAAALAAQAQDAPPKAGDAADPAPTHADAASNAPSASGRVGENVVTQAEDAFGTSIGRETIGIYNSSSVRGFSPMDAGNVRIDGLYFDQVWALTARLRRATTIRVGLSAQGYPFPAPTGVVDYGFRMPGDEASLSAAIGGDSYGSGKLELDAVLPLGRTLGLAVGGSGYSNEFYNGTGNVERVGAAALRWTPTAGIEIVPFWSRSDIRDNEIGPWYVPADAHLPPRVPRRRFDGPDWALYEGSALNYGALGRAELGDGWQLRAGLFRSLFDTRRDAYTLLTGLEPDGTGRFEALLYPSSKTASTSGEIRLSHGFSEGPRRHLLHASLRGRDRGRDYGGVAEIDLGDSFVGQRIDVPRPPFEFGPLARDAVRQWTAGLAYEGLWPGIGELSAGVQHSDYRKTIDQPGLPRAATRAAPWLFNATATVHLGPRLAAYAGYTRGMEESGIAPQTASNRNEALPAILTNQRDAGFRYRLGDRLSLVAGVFDVRKPYFTLDADDLYRQLGEVRSRGIEASLSGAVSEHVDVVLGAVLLRPRVHGPDVEAGIVGRRPVGLANRQLDLNADWRIAAVEGLSFDAGVSHVGAVPATPDNRVGLPPRTLVDIGGRYRFRLSGRDASLRISVANLFDEYAFELRGAGAYDFIAGRLASAYLTMDF